MIAQLTVLVLSVLTFAAPMTEEEKADAYIAACEAAAPARKLQIEQEIGDLQRQISDLEKQSPGTADGRRQKGNAGNRQMMATNALNQKKSCQAAVLASAKRRSLISAMVWVGTNAAISPDHRSVCCKPLTAPTYPKESTGVASAYCCRW